MVWVKRALLASITVVAVLAGLAVLWAGWLAWRYHQATPDYVAQLRDDQFSPTIARDENGVAHIFGDTMDEAWFGLGYAHAEDRLFEMDMMRRSIRGTLSQVLPPVIFGRAVLAADIRARQRGYADTATTIYAHMPDDGKAALKAYADGVNAFISQRREKWPFGYALLMTAPAPWQAEDGLTATLTMTHLLSVSSGYEPPNPEADENELTPQQRAIADIVRGQYPDTGITTVHAEDLPGMLTAPDLPDLGDEPRPGSNNWVLSGRRTASGLPLLASDPHLPPGLPSTWFLARLSTPQGNVVGATIPGAPYIIIGRNDHVAWGITNAGFDVSDTLYPATAEGIIHETATIDRRFGPPAKVQLARAPLGYAETPQVWHSRMEALGLATSEPAPPLSIRRTTDDDGDNLTAYAIHRFQYARSVTDLQDAMDRYWVAPVQTLVFADRDGNIGLQVAGRVPNRAPTGEWIDDLPPQESLKVVNPARGFAASANNRIHPDNYPYPIPGYYALDRIERIYAMLQERDTHDVGDMRAMQLDITSALARRFVPLWQAATPQGNRGETLRQRLLGWDHTMRAGATEPAIYSAWLAEFTHLVSADERELEDDADPSRRLRSLFLRGVLDGRYADWCDNVRTIEVESCALLAGRAFDILGASENADQEWSYRRHIRFQHPLFSRLPVIGNGYSREASIGGDGTTLNVAHSSLTADDARISFSTNYRMIVDFADLDASLFVHAPGQAAHPASPYFDNLLDDWQEGRYLTISGGDDPERIAVDGRITRFGKAR